AAGVGGGRHRDGAGGSRPAEDDPAVGYDGLVGGRPGEGQGGGGGLDVGDGEPDGRRGRVLVRRRVGQRRDRRRVVDGHDGHPDDGGVETAVPVGHRDREAVGPVVVRRRDVDEGARPVDGGGAVSGRAGHRVGQRI